MVAKPVTRVTEKLLNFLNWPIFTGAEGLNDNKKSIIKKWNYIYMDIWEHGWKKQRDVDDMKPFVY